MTDLENPRSRVGIPFAAGRVATLTAVLSGRKRLSSLFFLVSTMAASGQTNLVTNGGFESVTSPTWGTSIGWTDNNFASTYSNTGSYSLGFYGGYFRFGGPTATYQTISVVSGKSYTLSFYYGPGFPGDTVITPNILTVSFGGTTVASLTNVNTTTFSPYSYTVTATSNSAELRFSGGNDSSTSFVDDVSLVLIQTGPDASNTTAAMQTYADVLRSVMGRRLTGLALMSSYDCQAFDKYGVCLSFQARYTNFDSFNEGAGILTAAYRLTENVRLGAFIDYRASEKEPTGIKFSNDLPTFGAFVGYSQHLNGTGLQGKVLAAVQNGNATVTRDNSLSSTEPGSGKGSLNSYMISGELGWGFAVSPSMLATPYVGLRYTDATRGGYTEDTVSGTVDYPVSYSDYSQRLTTATIGVRLAGMLTEKVGYQMGAGLEHDLRQQTSAYSGTSSISGLETFAINVDGVKNRTRGVGSVGMFYQVEKNQRLMGNVSIRNQAYTSQTAVNVMGGYQIAF